MATKSKKRNTDHQILAMVRPMRRRNRVKLALRIGFTLGLALIFLNLLQMRLAAIEPGAVRQAFATVTPLQWALSLVATGVSFWAVGKYDATVHRHLATGMQPRVASRAGVAAIAISQTLGLGVVTGALVRWRMLPRLTLWEATQISVAVALSFLAGWAVVTCLVILALPDAPFKLLAGGGALVALGLAALCLAAPRLTFRRQVIRWPNGFTLGRILALAAVDTIAAALTLQALLPADIALPFATLLPAFLVALGAGLVSGTPGGIGAFEVTLLALLPTLPEAPLLAAILAYRTVYFALPAVIGAVMAALGPGRAATLRQPALPLDPDLARHGPRAEALLIRQGALALLPAGKGAWVAGRTAHGLIALFDPLETKGQAATRSAIRALRRAAGREGLLPCLYKCTARTAAVARAQGFQTLPIAREAVLDPRHFTLNTPSRAGLRRKLRKAETAGVIITTGPLPQDDMARVAAEWAQLRGGERGFSMGRFCLRYLRGQRVYLAWHAGTLVAFASFHTGQHEWALDLMRSTAYAPDGTMQTLITTALADAARIGLPRLSLAAAPLQTPPLQETRLLRHVTTRMNADDGSGLARFKDSFAPQWQPLYIAAPSRAGLLLCGAEVAQAILRPAPLQQAQIPAHRGFHAHHEDYEFASDQRAWQRKGK